MTVNKPTNPRRFTAATLLVASGAVAIGALGAAAPASASPDTSTVITSTSNTPIAKFRAPKPFPPIRLVCVKDKDGKLVCAIRQ
jgi:hypothetical protein